MACGWTSNHDTSRLLLIQHLASGSRGMCCRFSVVMLLPVAGPFSNGDYGEGPWFGALLSGLLYP